jgi:hypothetical protein
MKVELNIPEFLNAINIGVLRQCSSLRRGLKDAHGAKSDNGWDMHIEGACGEAAVAKALNVYWSGTVDTFKLGGDLGKSIQVRTRSKDYYELIVRKDDRDDDIFVLVTGKAPKFNVVGWTFGKNAKKQEWMQTHGGREAAWFVPQKELHDISSIPK